MPPKAHALLSASSAQRWLVCTAAPRFEEHFEDTTSKYAEEGSLAHSICELKCLQTFEGKPYLDEALPDLKQHELYSDEMLDTSQAYLDYLMETAQSFPSRPHMAFEVQVDLTDYIPEGFGTCDAIMIGGDRLHITDYKHGRGVQVSAVGNPQMRLYALGALRKYRAIYGDSIQSTFRVHQGCG